MADRLLTDMLEEFVQGLPRGSRRARNYLRGRKDWPFRILKKSDDIIGEEAAALGVKEDAIFVGYRMLPSGHVAQCRFAILEINSEGGLSISFCQRLTDGRWDYDGYRPASRNGRKTGRVPV